jgi:hypothetical protein
LNNFFFKFRSFRSKYSTFNFDRLVTKRNFYPFNQLRTIKKKKYGYLISYVYGNPYLDPNNIKNEKVISWYITINVIKAVCNVTLLMSSMFSLIVMTQSSLLLVKFCSFLTKIFGLETFRLIENNTRRLKLKILSSCVNFSKISLFLFGFFYLLQSCTSLLLIVFIVSIKKNLIFYGVG